MQKLAAHNEAEMPQYYKLPSGKYVTRVKYVEKETIDDGREMLKLSFEIMRGKYKGTQFPCYVGLSALSPQDLKELARRGKISGEAAGLPGHAYVDLKVIHMPCPDCGRKMKGFRMNIIKVDQSANKQFEEAGQKEN